MGSTKQERNTPMEALKAIREIGYGAEHHNAPAAVLKIISIAEEAITDHDVPERRAAKPHVFQASDINEDVCCICGKYGRWRIHV